MARHICERGRLVNRTKVLVLALFASYWVVLIVLLVAARGFYDSQLPQALRLPGNNQRLVEIGTLLAATALFAVLSIGVIRGWRWTFWLILIVFLVGIVRVPAAALQLAGIVPRQGPVWDAVLQAVVGLIQFVIALAMLAGYRKAGVWGAF
jgi:hypothetical protein